MDGRRRGVLTVRRKDFRRGHLTLRREDGRIICEKVEVADTIWRRMRGLLGRNGLASGEGLLIRPAWSIHTAFMRFPIDVVFVDHDLIVIRIAPSLRSFKTAACRGAREVVELPAGECERRGLEVGDRVAWASRNATPDNGEVLEHDPPSLTSSRSIILASDDQRFVKLTKFLLDGHGIDVAVDVRTADLHSSLEGERVDAVLIDAGDELGRALRLSNAVRASMPATPIVIVGDGAATRAPQSVAVYDKWDQMDEAIAALAGAA